MLGIWETMGTRLSWRGRLGITGPCAVCGWLGTLPALRLWSLKIPETPPMRSENWTEGRCVDAVCVWSCRTERNEHGTVVPPPPGVAAHETTTAAEAPPLDAGPHVGGASAAVAADPSPETGGGKGPVPGTGTTNHHAPSPDPEVVLGLTRENEKTEQLSKCKNLKERSSLKRINFSVCRLFFKECAF